jgi:hypothetical protein
VWTTTKNMFLPPKNNTLFATFEKFILHAKAAQIDS